MVHTHCTARKSTGRQPTGQLAPRNVPPQQELQHDSPQEDEPFEIMVTVPAGEDSQEVQPMPQNHDHDQQEEENNEKEEDEGNKAEGEDDEEYTPSSNTEKDDPHWQTDGFTEPHQHHHSARVQNQENSAPTPRRVQGNHGDP
jgi:hypothetical protein